MRKSSLATAVVAGLSDIADLSACACEPDALGQVLIYPYYTAQPGPSLVPPSGEPLPVAKVVKVRFLEGYNSREVIDFNLYLNPFDVWTSGATHDRD